MKEKFGFKLGQNVSFLYGYGVKISNTLTIIINIITRFGFIISLNTSGTSQILQVPFRSLFFLLVPIPIWSNCISYSIKSSKNNHLQTINRYVIYIFLETKALILKHDIVTNMILRKLEDFVIFIISGHNLINRRYAADTMLMADSEGKLKELLDEIVKEIEKKNY